MENNDFDRALRYLSAIDDKLFLVVTCLNQLHDDLNQKEEK